MTITIRLSPDDEQRLAERAARCGDDLAGYIRRLIERDLRSSQVVDEALAPFRRQIAESGLTDDELDAFFEGVRDEVWREKTTGPGRGG